MHDLRKKALLESGKTVSRKQRSKPVSARSSPHHSPVSTPGNSRAASRVGSRANSHYGSDDELDSAEDDFMSSSVDGEIDEDGDAEANAWVDALKDLMSELQDRKNSSKHSRQETLTAYNHVLSHQIAEKQVESSANSIINTLVKTVKASGNGTESALALRALALTILTSPQDVAYERVSQSLRSVCEAAEEDTVKVEAIRALGVASVYGGADDVANEDLLGFLLEIIESDGGSVGAADSCSVVEAALQTWAFVGAYEEDLSNVADQAMDAFAEQLDSGDVDVQSSAGSSIALLFERLRAHEEETGQSHDLQHNRHRILTRMAEIMRQSSKATGRKDRRTIRANLASVVTSLEREVGPGYSTALRHETPERDPADIGKSYEYGYRNKLHVGNMVIVIDSWSLKAKIEALKVLLGGGLGHHMLDNPTVSESLGRPEMKKVVNRCREKKDLLKLRKEDKENRSLGIKINRRDAGD